MQKYQVLDRIGQGAYGVVLKCRCNDTTSTKTKTIYDGSQQNIVAMKQFKQADDNEIVKKTTMRQVKVLKMLQHSNIVQLKQAFRKKGVVYLIFEFVPYNLLQVLEKSPQGLQLELIRKLIYQLLKGLAYLHSLNIVHRDIKLQNLLIGYHNQLKICDFGFARIVKKGKKQDLTDYVATRWYRPPQLLVGANYGKQIDVWAVGCILGQLIDGNPMFPGQNQQDQLFLIQKCLGPLTSEHQETFLKNPRFLGTKFPQINNLQTVQKRYLGKLPPKGLNLLKHLLKMNPNQRLTALEALEHPYFDGMRQQQLVRKFSSNNYAKNQQKNDLIISGASSSIPDRKKYGTNLYNPPIHTHGERQKTQSSQGQINFTSKNPKIHINKKPVPKKQDNFISSKGFNNSSMKSKSVAKGKVSKMGKQKNVSLQKYNNRETITKTQTGFYMVSGGVIHQRQEQEDSVHYNYPQYRNKIYNVRSPKSKKQNKRNNISTQQIQQQDPQGVWQSTGQLPFLMMASHKSTQNKNNKMNTNHPNIIITNSTFNYRNS